MKGLQRSLSRGNPVRQEIIKQSIPFSGEIAITGTADVVDGGSLPIGALPEGNVCLLGAVVYFAIEADANIVNDWTGDCAVGSENNVDNDANDPWDDDIIPWNALTSESGATSVARTRAAATSGETGDVLDNTENTLALNFNLLVDDNMITDAAETVFTVTGIIHIAYTMLGDD